MTSERLSVRQAAHYDRILGDYDRHYNDASSIAYREKFIYRPLFAGFDMNDWLVADLASGSGHNSRALLERFPRARVVGFDISPAACEAYRRLVGGEARCADLTAGYRGDERFDAAMIIGGLHHCVADLSGALGSVAAMVKPGGLFLMFEPNRRYLLQGLRNLWYRLDPLFDEKTESALDHDALARMASDRFRPVDVTYLGGPAFFLVYNSLIFRFSPAIKELLRRPLMAGERLYVRLPGRLLFACFVARWRRTADAGAG